MDLEPDGVAVLEQERDEQADVDAPTTLQRNDVRAELFALAFVGTNIGDVGEGELAGGHGVHLISMWGVLREISRAECRRHAP